MENTQAKLPNAPNVEWMGQSFSIETVQGDEISLKVSGVEVMNFVCPADYKLSCYLNRASKKPNYSNSGYR